METICFFIKKLIYAVVVLNNEVILEDRFDGQKTIEDIINLVKKDWSDLVQYQLTVSDNKNIKILLNEQSGSNTQLGQINSSNQPFYFYLECPNISQAQIQNKLNSNPKQKILDLCQQFQKDVSQLQKTIHQIQSYTQLLMLSDFKMEDKQNLEQFQAAFEQLNLQKNQIEYVNFQNFKETQTVLNDPPKIQKESKIKILTPLLNIQIHKNEQDNFQANNNNSGSQFGLQNNQHLNEQKNEQNN